MRGDPLAPRVVTFANITPYDRRSPPGAASSFPTYIDGELRRISATTSDILKVLRTTANDVAEVGGETSGRIDAIIVDLALANGRITDEASIRQTADGVIATRTATVEAKANATQSSLDGLSTIVTQATARIEEVNQASASSTAAVATRTATLEAGFTAQQSSLDGLSSGLSQASARITSVESAAATATGALATRTSTLEAGYVTTQAAIVSTNAAITNVETAQASATGALAGRTSTLEVNYGYQQTAIAATQGRITDVEAAQATATSALATRTSTLEASAGTLASRVTVTENAVADLANGDPNEAVWTVETVSGSNRAQISVHAAANGGAGVDIIGDVSISGSLIVGGTVTTGKIGAQAVTIPVSLSNGFTYIGDGNFVTVYDYTLSLPEAGQVFVFLSAGHIYSQQAAALWVCTVEIDGAVVSSRTGILGFAEAFTASASKALAAGSHNIKVRWKGGGSNIMLNTPELYITTSMR